MSSPYVGEIRMFAGNFAPAGWAFCDGSIIPISQNDTLFNLIGTIYGGDGQTNFALPDLRGRVPIHQGQGTIQSYLIGQSAGTETVTLATSQIPAHTHALIGSSANATDPNPAGNILASSTVLSPYVVDFPNNQLATNSIANSGGSQPHDNMMPFQCINYILSLYGVYPSQT
jgi:microcystin-dependent protein